MWHGYSGHALPELGGSELRQLEGHWRRMARLARQSRKSGEGWVDARSGQAVIASSRQGDCRWWRVVGRCLRTRGGREEVDLMAEADEAGQRSQDQQVGLKSPNNTDSNAPLA